MDANSLQNGSVLDAIQQQALKLLEEPYPYPEVIQIEIKTKKFNHTVLTNTTCPNCNHHFQANMKTTVFDCVKAEM